MKRILTLLAVFTMVLSAMAQSEKTTGIMLSKDKGKELRFYNKNQLMKAIAEATENDTLYLSAGSFNFNQLPKIKESSDHREWSKPLVVIGAGAQNGTSVTMDGTLYLNLDKFPLEQRNVSFEGIYIPNWVSPASEVNELSFINYRGTFYDSNNLIETPDDADESWEKPHTYIKKVIIDRCQMESIDLQEENVKDIYVSNSKVTSAVNGRCTIVPEMNGQLFTLDHCRIQDVGSNFEGLVQNSMINYDYASSASTFDSCGVNYGDYSSSNRPNCVHINGFDVGSDDAPTLWDPNQGNSDVLQDMGTTSSFSLYPSYPTLNVEESEIDKFDDSIKITVGVQK